MKRQFRLISHKPRSLDQGDQMTTFKKSQTFKLKMPTEEKAKRLVLFHCLISNLFSYLVLKIPFGDLVFISTKLVTLVKGSWFVTDQPELALHKSG